MKNSMVEITEEIRKQYFKILDEKRIMPVYQPIVSLRDGRIEGYEALSRIKLEGCLFNVEEMFEISEKLNSVWELEELCRQKSIEYAMDKPEEIKLFLNVDPKVLRDEKFERGMTGRYLKHYGLKPEEIIFEVTERSSIEDEKLFQETIANYKGEEFQIAIDDFGNGYAGLNRVCSLKPEYVKIDIGVVNNIDQDKYKQSLVESFIIFCKNAGIHLIAEGIETQKEMEELIRLGVEFGQGYYIQRPERGMYEVPSVIRQEIRKCYLHYDEFLYKPSLWDGVGTIAHRRNTVYCRESASEIYDLFMKSKDIAEICVVDQEEKAVGLLTRSHIMEVFGGRYGFNLHSRDTVEKIMMKEALSVETNTSIEIVSKMALSRPMESLYDAVIVTENEKYQGMVTVKDLLETAISIQVSKAMDANPLTGLPGNSVIQEKIKKVLEEQEKYHVIYFDLDNFKAYNDAYGFQNGDLMIKALAVCLEEACSNGEFVGHIGGDDLVIITREGAVEEIYQVITERFMAAIQGLYSKEDWNRGFISSVNRNGFPENFPIATISAAAISAGQGREESMDDFSKRIAEVKEQAKKKRGNSLIIA